MAGTQSKYCGGCRARKPITEFYRHPISRDGYKNKCKTCCKRYGRTYRLSHPKTAEDLARQRQYNQEYRARKREQINARRRAARAEADRIARIRQNFTGQNNALTFEDAGTIDWFRESEESVERISKRFQGAFL